MVNILLLLTEGIIIMGEFCWDLIAKNIFPWLSEKFKPTFSISPCQDLPSAIQATFNRNKTTALLLSVFVFVKNHTNAPLYLTEAFFRKPTRWRFAEHVTLSRQYIPAGEECQILVSVCLPKATYYPVKKENISAILCIKANGIRKQRVKIMLKNTTNQNSNTEEAFKKIRV